MPEATIPPKDLLYLEDLYTGRRFTSRAYPLEAAEVIAFASAYDPQPFHTDAEAARDSFFGGLAASGWQTAAVTMRLIVESMPFAGGVIGGGCEINWPRPTLAGDTLTIEIEVLEAKPSRTRPDRGSAVLSVTTLNQTGEVVQTLKPKVLVFRRPPSRKP